jgi:hypothetical protein
MFNKTFHFEIQDLLTQFIAAMDDVVIGRYNKNREQKEKIKVRYVHAPKERVLFDIVNKAQNITLPVISVALESVSRDQNRVFNKIDGMYAPIGKNIYGRDTAFIAMPIPVDLNVSLSIITNYQSDMDQILSNFVPYSNPYIVICWKIPEEFGIKDTEEIRSVVMWDGNINLEYPKDLEPGTKPRFVANTSFLIKGWLFPQETEDYAKNIYFVKSNFRTTSQLLLNYDQIASLSAEAAVYDTLTNTLKETEFVNLSGSPYITNLYMNTSGGPIELVGGNVIIGSFRNTFTILGKNFDTTSHVLISSDSSTFYTNYSAFGYTYYPTVSGFILPKVNYKILNKNAIFLSIPFAKDTANINFVVLNSIGWKDTNSINTNLLYISGI